MLGNLSKILIRVPDFFNNSTLNTTKEIGKLKIKDKLSVFNSNNKNNTRKYKLQNIYFREKDFWLKNYEPGINFNHNRRFNFSHKNSNLKNISYKNYLITNKENKTNLNNIDTKRKNYYLTDNQIKKNNKSEEKNISTINNANKKISENNDLQNELCRKTESQRISNRKMFNLGFNNSLKDSITENENKKDGQSIKNKDNKRYKYKPNFPSIYSTLKSQENLFQDRLDRKFNSLKMLKPEIKEQLKTMNRSMVGKKQYFDYLSQNKIMFQNPFYESIKLKEELNNIKMK